jgi:ABC-2 type transport system permease protein
MMVNLRPGSFLWLLRHELRLSFRTKRSGPWMIAATIVLLLVLQGIGILSAFGFAKMDLPAPLLHLVLGGAGLFMIAMNIAIALQLLVNGLYTRGDYDLLLSSPLSPSVILPVRMVGTFIAMTSGVLIFTAPFFNGGAIIISARWLVGYLALPTLSLITLSVSFLLLLGLVRLLGPRRAKTVAQVFAGIVGMGGAIAWQLMGTNAGDQQARLHKGMEHTLKLADTPGADAVRWLGAAISGEPAPLAILLAVGIGGFAAICWLAGPAFLRLAGSTAAADLPVRRGNAARPTGLRVRGRTMSVLLKEWRLIWRDPALLTQVMSIGLMVVPLAFSLHRQSITTFNGASIKLGWLGAPPTISLLAGALVWLAVVAEDAPDLLGTAPVARSRLLLDQMLAAALPSLVILTGISLYLAPSYGMAALMIWLTGVLGILLFLLLDMRQAPSAGGRKAFQKRYQGQYLILMAEMVLAFSIYGLGVLAVWGDPFWMLPLLLIGIGLAGAALITQPPRAIQVG